MNFNTEVMFSTATIGRWSRGIKLAAATSGGRWSLAAKCVGASAFAFISPEFTGRGGHGRGGRSPVRRRSKAPSTQWPVMGHALQCTIVGHDQLVFTQWRMAHCCLANHLRWTSK